jgi:transposase
MTWLPNELTANRREERRLKAGQLLRATDLSQAAIARIVGVGRTAAAEWKQQIKQCRHRVAVHKNRPRPGYPPWLTAQQLREALRRLKRGAQAFGFETARWALGRVWQLIKQEYGVIYNANYLGRQTAATWLVSTAASHLRQGGHVQAAARAALHWHPKISTTRSVRQRNV